MPPGDALARELALELEKLAGEDDPRAAVLAAHLERLKGQRAMGEWIEGFDPGVPWPFDAAGSWRAADVLAPGSLRNRALVEALALRAEPLDDAQVRRVYDGWIEAALDLRFDEALALARPLHEEVKADWSAISLSLTLNRAGRWEEADRVLEQAIDLGLDPTAMWTQRGIYALGAGQEVLGQSFLERAIQEGSVDAVAVLARADLAEGRYAAARKGFKEVLLRQPDYPWAWRGFGLSLLFDGPWTDGPHQAKLRSLDLRPPQQPAPSTALRKP
jgi:tetratricopeptide (TPR) repeat protein